MNDYNIPNHVRQSLLDKTGVMWDRWDSATYGELRMVVDAESLSWDGDMLYRFRNPLSSGYIFGAVIHTTGGSWWFSCNWAYMLGITACGPQLHNGSDNCIPL